MKNLTKLYCLIFILIFLSSCTEKISHTGNIVFFDSKIYKNFSTKNDVEKYFGSPNFIDPIEKKFFYFSETKVKKNFFSDNLIKRNLLIFHFNIDNKIISINEFNLDDEKELKLVKDQTSDEIIKQGLLEKVFGGVGTGPGPVSE